MRRIALFVGLISLFALPSSLAAAGGKPTRVPYLAGAFFTEAANTACSFPLQGAPAEDKEVITTFPAQANGDVVQLITGNLVETLTNLSNNKSITLNLSGPLLAVTHTDGSATVTEWGPSIIVFFPTDIPAGPNTIINYGRVVLNYTPSGLQILVSRTGSQFDLCAALS